MQRLLMAVIAAGILMTFPAGLRAQQVTSTSIPCQTFFSEFVVGAKSDTLWSRLNTTQTLADIMGLEFRAGLKKTVEVGDAAYMRSERDTGKVILSYVKRRTEMRFVFEPDSGMYFSEDVWNLTPQGATQTRVTFLRRRTLFTAQVTTEIADQLKIYNETIARLKSIAKN